MPVCFASPHAPQRRPTGRLLDDRADRQFPCRCRCAVRHPVSGDSAHPAALLLSCKADLVIGERPLRQRGLQSGLIGHLAYGLIIAPKLAAGWSDTPGWDQLSTVHGIDFAPQDRIVLDQLALCLPGSDPVGLRCHYVNNTAGVIAWAVAGGGFSAVPLHQVRQELQEGRLRRLFPAVTMRRPLYWSALAGLAAPAATETVARLKRYLPETYPG
ncbi:MAG: hypothetical protein H7338_17845 [Candidatus Sericytochromatia bacterium]|nr:hypothetical protein [Candidatus Sericytochromatia bacterium]